MVKVDDINRSPERVDSQTDVRLDNKQAYIGGRPGYYCNYEYEFLHLASLNTSRHNRAPCGAGAPLFSLVHHFPPFTFPFLSLALPIFFFCPSLSFLPE